MYIYTVIKEWHSQTIFLPSRNHISVQNRIFNKTIKKCRVDTDEECVLRKLMTVRVIPNISCLWFYIFFLWCAVFKDLR